MLTVDYDRLGVRPGDRLLDLGCGFGRHAYQAARAGRPGRGLRRRRRRGAQRARHLRGHGHGRRARPRRRPGWVRSRATPCPALRGRHLRPGDRLRGPRAHPRRRAGHGRADPGAPARRHHGGDHPRCGPEFVNWALSDEYHNVARWPRQHLPAEPAGGRLESTGLRRPGATTPTACTPPTGGSGAWWAPTNDDPRCRHLPPAAGVGHREGAEGHPGTPTAAQPVGGQEPGGLLDQARSPADPSRRPLPPGSDRPGGRPGDGVDAAMPTEVDA